MLPFYDTGRSIVGRFPMASSEDRIYLSTVRQWPTERLKIFAVPQPFHENLARLSKA